MFSILILLIALASTGAALTLPASNVTLNGMSACNELLSTFPSKAFGPNAPLYNNESTRIWSMNCVLSPNCVFIPDNAQDIAKGLSIIRKYRSPFSVRSGGHMPVPGAASTDDGVFISLSKFTTRNLVKNNSVAQIGPGQIWDDVYGWIAPQGLAVAGGRFGEVGVGGLLLGGGINYFGNSHGWAMNSIVGFQVVLGDSSVVEVSASSYSDLFWALKGGNNNFGIVTRFDLKTIQITSAYEGGEFFAAASVPSFLEALTTFIGPGGGIEDPNTAVTPLVAITPQTGIQTAELVVFVAGNATTTPPSVAPFANVSGSTFNDIGPRADWASIAHEANNPLFVTRTQRQGFRALGLKTTPEAIQLAYNVLIPSAGKQLANVNGSSVAVTFQPISKSWLQAARNSGGDAIDLDPADGPFISLLISTTWNNAADDDQVNKWAEDNAAILIQKAKAMGIYYPFIYLNDAAPGQQPYPLYGKGKSLPRMLSIQKKYDPEGVFRNLASSGFKLSG